MQKNHKTCGMSFWVEPGYENQLLGPEAPNWVDLAGDKRAVLVKGNPRRKIWRVRLDEINVYVKRYEPGGLVGWVKRLFRSSPAAVEFKNHQLAQAAGVNCPKPLAFAQKGWRGTGGTSILITAAVEAAEPLDVYLQENPMDDQLVRLLAELLGRGHRAGLAQADPHLGNFLIRIKSDGKQELILTDLQKLHKIPSEDTGKINKAAQQNLACCYAAVNYYLNSEQRKKFLAEYLAVTGLQNEKDIRCLQPKIERMAWKQSLRRWAGRDKRSCGNNEYFRRIRPVKNWKGSVLLTTKRPLPDSAASNSKFTPQQWLKALENPRGLFAGAETVSDSGDSLVVGRKLKVGQVELDVHCKLFRRAAGLKKSPAQRAYENGFALLNRLIPTVMPLAWLCKQIGLYGSESILITETVPGAINLAEYSEKEEVAQALAELKAELGRYGFVHQNFGATNVLIKCNPDGPKQLIVSHCESIRKVRKKSPRRTRRSRS
ncbi:MAG: hypothetical protein GWP14_10010 [Actinobacteria bacterium]|nr:hypothetical protein [Actinomycetota bacterium]